MNLRTISLRRRVAVSVLLVLFLVLVALVISVDRTFAGQSNRDVDVVLLDASNRASQMLSRNIPPREVVRQLTKRNIHVTVELPNGTRYGEAPEEGPFQRKNEVIRGVKFAFYADTEAISQAQVRLRKLLIMLGIGAIVV
ncbi:MAG TPA: sensor histidine kinase, partial [Lentzea sp.]